MANTDLSCGESCLKYLLFVVNFIVWVCGIVVLGVGIYSRVKAGDWSDLLEESAVIDAANLLIASGAIVLVIGFVGCCGALKQARPLLVIYAILLILIFVLEIAGGIYAAVKKDDVIKSLQKGLQKSMTNSYGGTSEADKGYTESIDWFQENVKCCGSTGPQSWNNTKWDIKQKEAAQKDNATVALIVPNSCCIKDNCNKVATYGELKADSTYMAGCVKESEKFLDTHTKELVGVGIGIAFIQILGIVFAILLCRAIGQNEFKA